MKKSCVLALLATLTIGSMGTVDAAYATIYTAKTLGMGGAGVAAADDVNAVWYNPAAMAFIENKEIGAQHIEGTNTLTFVSPLNKNNAWGVYGAYDSENVGGVKLETTAFRLAYGQKINDNTAFGVNLDRMSNKASSGGVSISDSETNFGASFLQKNDRFSYGVAFNKGDNASIITPGIAYKLNDKTTIACDLWDMDYLQIGVEHAVNDKIKARVGSLDGEFTIGVGVKCGSSGEFNFGHTSGINAFGYQQKF